MGAGAVTLGKSRYKDPEWPPGQTDHTFRFLSHFLYPAPLLSLPLSLTVNSRPIKTVYCPSIHFTVTYARHNFIVSNSKYTLKPLMLKEMVWWGFAL